MSGAHSTIRERDEDTGDAGEGPAQPGLVVVFAVDSPRFVPLPLHHGRILLGRDRLLSEGVDDRNVSRAHLEVTLRGEQWQLRDLGSTNGSAVDGAPLLRGLCVSTPRVLRIGRTLLLPCADLRPLLARGLHVRDGVVVGPTLADVHERIRRLARAGQGLLLTGASGVGKEVAARVFHAASGRPRGPFVAVNCATIPAELAERLLFGARKGAYSGAVENAEGHIQAADAGTLFLDEIGELEPRVQAKLLRVLETRE
ncbi:MAG: sigma 54-interacting transcriptional regulator, partial [Myxococcales bacterium]|nr:sigma 54-interacting transcriptional regulator [Myxococcales bacterium]